MGPSRRSGLTLLEILIAVAILGVLLGISFVQLRPNSAQLFASDVKGLVQQARYEAVKRNSPVAVVWDADAGMFVSGVSSTSSNVSQQCSDMDVRLQSHSPSEYRGLQITQEPTLGLVWLPTGQGRTCGGAPTISTRLTISDGRAERVVSVSPGGKVSVE